MSDELAGGDELFYPLSIVFGGRSPNIHPTVEISVQCGPETGTARIVERNPAIPEMEREVLRGNSEIGPVFHGSGLGLWLVNHIVRDADGFLQFEENDPQGNIVAIHLPRATDK